VRPYASKATVDRLPLYFRTLRLLLAEGESVISSSELGRRLDLTPEQIRKDLSIFGNFGKHGVGYYVQDLMVEIGDILGLKQQWNLVVVGLGHLGKALVNYKNFTDLGFRLRAIFETDEKKVGTIIGEVPVYHVDAMAEFSKENPIDIGVITVPSAAAQMVADRLIENGVKGIWNFAPQRVVVPRGICLVHEDLSVGLSSLSYYVANEYTAPVPVFRRNECEKY